MLDTWRTWELVLPALQRHHDVFAPTLAGHAGGPPLTTLTEDTLADAVEEAMDAAGLATAAFAGNSLGGYLALRLAERGRATAVVALAPAGGWKPGDPHVQDVIARQRRREISTRDIVCDPSAIPPELLAHIGAGVAACPEVDRLTEAATTLPWTVHPDRITCPTRFVWGLEDRLLPYPAAATRYRAWFPTADWVELDGVGHSPQLDTPLETAQLILGFTA
ncbi:MAG: hypothetical protein QOF76_5080 [Solirubrobacteraceae bacterium]|nr:hypothetical protein [Solirubrobacteraceae bacterium]